MSRVAAFLERLPGSCPFFLGLLPFLLLIFAVANVPWHLDDYDQAKQAYVAFDIAKNGELWFQHTPVGLSASKPPLMGWLSAGLHAIGLPWELAFRLPSFLAAVAMLLILAREGHLILGQAGATIAIAAFGLNLLTPRLATLVRTDMLLGAFIFLIGWLIYRKIRAGTAWTPRERWLLFAAMLGALLTKGPVIYAFLLPALIGYPLLVRDPAARRLAWSGAWTWLLPLAAFLTWGLAFLATHPEFYHDVVQREFLSRFQSHGRTDERPQPLWFYLPHLLQKFAPWSLFLLAAPLISPPLRRGLRDRPATLWLILWALGGLLVMTLIPAKRVDRIYPIIAPLSLLLVEFAAALWPHRHVRIATGAALLAALAFTGGYYLGLIPLSFHDRTPALVEFAQKARATAAAHGIAQITLPRTRDEGLLLYLDAPRFADKSDAKRRWSSGPPLALVMAPDTARDFFAALGQPVPTPAVATGPLLHKNDRSYALYLRE